MTCGPSLAGGVVPAQTVRNGRLARHHSGGPPLSTPSNGHDRATASEGPGYEVVPLQGVGWLAYARDADESRHRAHPPPGVVARVPRSDRSELGGGGGPPAGNARYGHGGS